MYTIVYFQATVWAVYFQGAHTRHLLAEFTDLNQAIGYRADKLARIQARSWKAVPNV